MPAMCQPCGSEALRIANNRLRQLQAESKKRRRENKNPPSREVAPHPGGKGSAQELLEKVKLLADHLGWGSANLTHALRLSENALSSSETDTLPKATVESLQTPVLDTRTAEFIAICPDLAIALLKHDLAAPGRLWYLLRYYDWQGRGWVELDEAYRVLTDKTGKLGVCGKRHLRRLLGKGEGIFWQKENGRLWLRSRVRVAKALALTHLSLRPVEIPLSVLTSSIGLFRAHLYTSFHSARENGQPIARITIEKVTGVPRRTQQIYEDVVGVKSRENYALGEKATAEGFQELAWKKGKAVFLFTDYKGYQGPPGERYVAWQMPNDYIGPHSPSNRGRIRRTNKKLLADLRRRGAGNSKSLVYNRRYFDSGRRSIKAFDKQGVDKSATIFWLERRSTKGGGLWCCLCFNSLKNP